MWRHQIGSDPTSDTCVFHEEDEGFYVGLGRSRDDRFLYISAGSAVTSDQRFLPADAPLGEWRLILPREHEVEYSASARGDAFVVTLRDADRPNSEVLLVPIAGADGAAQPRVLLPHRPEVKVEAVSVSAGHLVSFERREGLQQAIVHALGPDGAFPDEELGDGEPVALEEPAYELGPGAQGDFASPVLRLVYSSLKTPVTTLDVNLRTGARRVKKVQPVLGGFDAAKYATERLWAEAADGARVPISLVYRRDLARLDGSDPLLLDGYGSYEVSNDPDFRSTRLPLLDRGVTFAIAHIRGGGVGWGGRVGGCWPSGGACERRRVAS